MLFWAQILAATVPGHVVDVLRHLRLRLSGGRCLEKPSLAACVSVLERLLFFAGGAYQT